MNRNVPKLRKHATGQWFCKWGGRNRYFGTKRTEAQKEYLKSLAEWTEWREQRDTRRFPSAGWSIVTELAERFLAQKQREGGMDLRRYYDKHLQRFVSAWGPAQADRIGPQDLQAFKDDMLVGGYAPKTVNHDLVAVKGMFKWAAGLELVANINFRGVKCCPLGPPPAKALSAEAVQGIVEEAENPLKAWLAVNYLCLMRPVEVVRVAHQQGEWVEEGVFRLDRGKMDKKVRLARHVVFSYEAMGWLAELEPKWSRLDSYSAAVRRVFGSGGPHPLRHSAATHLGQAGASRGDVDLLLGHAPSRVSLIYNPISWQPLREVAALLSLRSDA